MLGILSAIANDLRLNIGTWIAAQMLMASA